VHAVHVAISRAGLRASHANQLDTA
jgi:hypothetical protein